MRQVCPLCDHISFGNDIMSVITKVEVQFVVDMPGDISDLDGTSKPGGIEKIKD